MKVILLQDVEHLGKAGEIKDVSGGFGRNYLIPKGYAVLATRGQIKQAEQRLAAEQRRAETVRRDAEAVAARINGRAVTLTVKVGEQDRLYGSVTSSDIAEQIAAQLGVEVDRRKIELGEPIKRTGTYPVTVRLMSGVEPVVNVVVAGEGGLPAAATFEPETAADQA
ncbi:MAG: 50S ribosomal protein L9 [Chloroflexaceae bacterium]|nr:50S ribosomal protein L9 [Chloroflexaceae bacterium]